MKALLVIEIPNSCGECRFCDYNDSIKTSFCTADTSHMFSMQEEGGVYTIQRNKQCPLKPMPKKKEGKKEFGWNCCEYTKFTGFEDGWNACIDEIIGETE